MMKTKDYFALLRLREKLSKSSSAVAVRAIEIINEKLKLNNYD